MTVHTEISKPLEELVAVVRDGLEEIKTELGVLCDRLDGLSQAVQVQVTVDLDDKLAGEIARTVQALQGIEDKLR